MRSRWLRAGAIKLHVGALVVVGAMLALGWWQLQRALHGHTRSWAYAIQWTAFAAYVGYLWWRLLGEEPGFAKPDPDAGASDGAHASARDARAAARSEAEERELAAYNEQLAAYNERLAALRDTSPHAGR